MSKPTLKSLLEREEGASYRELTAIFTEKELQVFGWWRRLGLLEFVNSMEGAPREWSKTGTQVIGNGGPVLGNTYRFKRDE